MTQGGKLDKCERDVVEVARAEMLEQYSSPGQKPPSNIGLEAYVTASTDELASGFVQTPIGTWVTSHAKLTLEEYRRQRDAR